MLNEFASQLDDCLEQIAEDWFNKLEVNLYMSPSDNAALKLLSIGELVDRLAIVNIKLYKLKDFQVASQNITDLSLSAKKDVELVKERANLKAAITQKAEDTIARVISNCEIETAFEVKSYGEVE